MERICSFTEYVTLREGARLTSSKTGLYPLGYGGIGLYPNADYLTHAADAILYLTQDSRLYDNGDKAPFDISHLPGHTQYGDRVNSGEAEPFDIRDLPGKVVPPKETPVPGKIVPFKGFVKLVTDPKTISPRGHNLPNWK
jgi:hypothetical protein